MRVEREKIEEIEAEIMSSVGLLVCQTLFVCACLCLSGMFVSFLVERKLFLSLISV